MKTGVVAPEPEVLRTDVIERVRHLDTASVLVLHGVLRELEKHRLWAEISEEAAADHRAGLFDHLPEMLRVARESIRNGG